ncbi:MAG: adenosine kinase [Bacteroidales bacterium]|nr:adenosine kinase [Bacteroidales bacterium]
MTKVLGIGNALVDIMTKLKSDETLSEFKLPKGSMQLVDLNLSEKINEQTEDLEKQIASGGSAANTIHGLAKLGIETGFIGKVGDDFYGKFFADDMDANNITPNLLTSTTLTGKAMALISPDSERTFATFLGAAIELSAEDLKDEHFNGFDYLHVEGYLVQNHDLIEEALKLAKKAGLKISLDMASFNVVEANLGFLKKVVDQYVDIVFANEEEAKSFTGKEPEEALHEFAKMVEIAVVKVGKNGSWIKKGEEVFKVDAIQAGSIDTTGAGDLYASGFLFGLIKGYDLDKCGRIGSILAGKTIEVIGPKMDSAKWSEVSAMMENL